MKYFSRNRRAVASILLTTSILAVLIILGDPNKLLTKITKADPIFLVLALVSANIPLLIFGLVWKKVLKIIGVELDFKLLYQVLLANTFLNNITPFGNIGGEAAATYYLSKITGKPPAKLFSAVFTASLINFTPLATLLVFGLALSGKWSYLAGLVILTCILAVLKKQRVKKLRIPYVKSFESIRSFLQQFKNSLNNISDRKVELFPYIIFTHLFLIFDILSVILIGQAYNINLVNPLILVIVPLARVANYLPTPGGSGPYELTFAFLLDSFLEIGLDSGILIAVTYRVLTYYVGLFLGYIALNSLNFRKNI